MNRVDSLVKWLVIKDEKKDNTIVGVGLNKPLIIFVLLPRSLLLKKITQMRMLKIL
jgi:hypothetical protein